MTELNPEIDRVSGSALNVLLSVEVGDQVTFRMSRGMYVLKISTEKQAELATELIRSGEAFFTLNE